MRGATRRTASSSPRRKRSSRRCARGSPTSRTGRRGRRGRPRDRDALFRAAHSLKALAGMFRFDPISALAHGSRDVLDQPAPRARPLGGAARLDRRDGGAVRVAPGSGRRRRGGRRSAERIEEADSGIAALTGAAPRPSDEFAALDLDANVLRGSPVRRAPLRGELRRGRTSRARRRAVRDQDVRGGARRARASCARAAKCSRRARAGDSLESQIPVLAAGGDRPPEAEPPRGSRFPGATKRTVRAGRAPLAARPPHATTTEPEIAAAEANADAPAVHPSSSHSNRQRHGARRRSASSTT